MPTSALASSRRTSLLTLLLDLIGWLALGLTVVFIASSLLLLVFGDALTDHDPDRGVRTTNRPAPDSAVPSSGVVLSPSVVLASSAAPTTSGPGPSVPDRPHPVAA